jgi:hypothetical protein
MIKKVGQEVAQARLLAQIAIGAGGEDKSWSRSISNIWNEYLRAVYYQQAQHEDLERDMQDEYKKFSHLRPKMVIQEDGSLRVTGIPKSAI